MENEVGRRVVCAANRMPDGTLILGARHWDPLMCEHARLLGVKGGDEVQGFIDQNRQFLTREEAWVVAREAGQIIRRVGGDEGCLYSENLY
ncbi:MAG: hypothetical protein ACRC9G_09135 [Aeromonas veronii]